MRLNVLFLSSKRWGYEGGDGQNTGSVGIDLALVNTGPCGWVLTFHLEAGEGESSGGQLQF